MTASKELHRLDVETEGLVGAEPAKPSSAREEKALIDCSHDMISFSQAEQTTPIAVSIDQV